jgi:hypothetical protein
MWRKNAVFDFYYNVYKSIYIFWENILAIFQLIQNKHQILRL